MVGVVLDELEVNAAGAAFDHWIGYLNERLARHREEPQTPAQREAIDSLETAIIHAVSAKLRIAQALEDDYPPDSRWADLADPTVRWHTALD